MSDSLHLRVVGSAKRIVICSLVVSLQLVHSHPARAQAINGDELCPVASDRLNRSVSYRNNVIRAPVTAAETAALMMTLQGGRG